MELHERIYQLRKENKLTQQDLADRLKVSRQAVSRWEMGTAKPEIESLAAMAKVFGTTVDELLTGEKSPAAEAVAAPEKPKHRLRKWIIAWALTWLAVLAVFAAVTFVQWKFGGALVAIAPVPLIIQSINLGFDLGIVFIIAYWIHRMWQK